MISTASKTFFFFFSLEGPVRRESNALSSEWKFREKQLTTVTAAKRHLLDNLQRGGVVVDHQNPETHRKLRRSRSHGRHRKQRNDVVFARIQSRRSATQCRRVSIAEESKRAVQNTNTTLEEEESDPEDGFGF